MNIGGNIKDILKPQYNQQQNNKEINRKPAQDAAIKNVRAKAEKKPGSDNKTVDNMLKPSSNRVLRLEINDKLDIVVAKIVNKDTGETVRQIPPESAVELMQTLRDRKGVMVKEEA